MLELLKFIVYFMVNTMVPFLIIYPYTSFLVSYVSCGSSIELFMGSVLVGPLTILAFDAINTSIASTLKGAQLLHIV